MVFLSHIIKMGILKINRTIRMEMKKVKVYFIMKMDNLKKKYFMKNGKLDGEAINYFEDGKIRHKAIYKDGIILEEEVHENNEIQKNILKMKRLFNKIYIQKIRY